MGPALDHYIESQVPEKQNNLSKGKGLSVAELGLEQVPKSFPTGPESLPSGKSC